MSVGSVLYDLGVELNRWNGDTSDTEALAELHSTIQFAESVVGDFLASERGSDA